MATIFNKRLFGTDLDPEIKNKLRARQILAKASVLPHESTQFVTIQGQDYSIQDIVGNINFPDDRERLIHAALPNIGAPAIYASTKDKSSLADLSSRTPFARMWTCVELYWSLPDKWGDKYGTVEWDSSWDPDANDTKWTKTINRQMKQEAKTVPFEKVVYTVNNHHLDSYYSNTANPYDSLLVQNSKNRRLGKYLQSKQNRK